MTKIDAAGSALVYSTYLGGNDLDQGNAIAADSMGNAYVTGVTWSTDFPTKNAIQPTCRGCPNYRSDAFVTKISATGSALVYSTYLGGSRGAAGTGIAVDASSDTYVTGYTESIDFPTINAIKTFGYDSGGFLSNINVVSVGRFAKPVRWISLTC